VLQRCWAKHTSTCDFRPQKGRFQQLASIDRSRKGPGARSKSKSAAVAGMPKTPVATAHASQLLSQAPATAPAIRSSQTKVFSGCNATPPAAGFEAGGHSIPQCETSLLLNRRKNHSTPAGQGSCIVLNLRPKLDAIPLESPTCPVTHPAFATQISRRRSPMID